MKTYVAYLLVVVACCGLFFLLKDLEIGLLSAAVISVASVGLSYLMVEFSFKLGVDSSIDGASLSS